jgi:hypothetical protein
MPNRVLKTDEKQNFLTTKSLQGSYLGLESSFCGNTPPTGFDPLSIKPSTHFDPLLNDVFSPVNKSKIRVVHQ